MQQSYFLFFIFGEVDKVGGNEISNTYFIFNVCGGIAFFIYGSCEYLNVGITLGSINHWRS